MNTVRYHFASLSSTNDWAKKHGDSFPQDQLVIVSADSQTEGRGQYGRAWHSPQGENLYASFCFFTPEGQENGIIFLHLLAETIQDFCQQNQIICSLKPPNDLLIHNKKVAGILCETKSFNGKWCCILGMGLNLNMKREELLKINQPATSLREETGKIWEQEPVLEAIKKGFLQKLRNRLFMNLEIGETIHQDRT